MDTLSCVGIGKVVGAMDVGVAKRGRVDDSKLLADTCTFASMIQQMLAIYAPPN